MHARLGTQSVARSAPVATNLVRRRLTVAGSHAIATREFQPSRHSLFLQSASAKSLCASYANRFATGLVACDSWRRPSSRIHHRHWLHQTKPSPSPSLSFRCAASDASADSRGQAEADGAAAAVAGKAPSGGGASARVGVSLQGCVAALEWLRYGMLLYKNRKESTFHKMLGPIAKPLCYLFPAPSVSPPHLLAFFLRVPPHCDPSSPAAAEAAAQRRHLSWRQYLNNSWTQFHATEYLNNSWTQFHATEYLNNSWTQFHATDSAFFYNHVCLFPCLFRAIHHVACPFIPLAVPMPSPFQFSLPAASPASARDLLRAAGYEQLREAGEWQLLADTKPCSHSIHNPCTMTSFFLHPFPRFSTSLPHSLSAVLTSIGEGPVESSGVRAAEGGRRVAIHVPCEVNALFFFSVHFPAFPLHLPIPSLLSSPASARDLLRAAGYEQLREADEWQLRPGGKYFFTRNLSSIVAFAVGEKASPASLPLRIVAAHTDSPCLKLKPVSAATKGGCLSLAVQTYGGGLWHTWFDRDLSVAGRVLVQGEDGRVVQRLVKIDRPILRIPTLAIHLDRNVNTDGFKPNAETHLVPVLATHIKAQLRANNGAAAAANGAGSGSRQGVAEGGAATAAAAARVNGKTNGTGSSNGSGGGGGGGNGNGNGSSEHHPLLLELLAEQLSCPPSAILDFELNVCDTQRSVAGAGGAGEFIFSGRLDNLACCYTALQALIDAEGLQEERGVRRWRCSITRSGAASPTMYNAIKRIVKQMPGVNAEEGAVERSLRASFLVSADMAHALHPNYPEKHEERHQPRMGAGMVVKHNANQRYATNLVSSFLFKNLAAKHGLPCQSFVVRNDMGCGSTIGPILASGLGIRTVDVGIPQLSMHSIREMCASDDIDTAYHLFKAFYSTAFAEVEDSLDLDE
ncbi:unnamed protein product [Closterium sp. Yama58-4]|nr:unnamed protein product [Closterium sp. Yama58-4]